MPHQLRNRTPVTSTEPTSSAASSATLEHTEHTEPATERPTLRERPESRRPKRGLRALSGEESPNVAFDETPSLPKRKRRKVEQSKDLVDTESLRISILKSLNTLSQAQENHQRITTTITEQVETQNRRLLFELRELQESHQNSLLEGFKDWDNQERTLFSDLIEDLQAEQRRQLEESFKDTEQLVRTLVVNLVEGMSTQQRGVIGMKRFIQQYGAGKEGAIAE
ncbi:uncharacterized protein PAC_19835 [Phialocephala subalpina]|uniref:Uncharacterized protein n=1 Tax=Phialocephala subalpina TaxID=576137 RepID=A0A1L7XY56_9HELO|nr:uncharacterized protein PAC_19835 [Phialocephala subalpina]